ncbi:MAG: ShlB/FhaC/HecB family hemolysin secretion/activation protein [Prochlorotrichaceae cyanobacterium]
MIKRIRWIQGSLITFSCFNILNGMGSSPSLAQLTVPSEVPPPVQEEEIYVPVDQTLIEEIRVVGSTVFSLEQLNAVVNPYEGQTLSTDQLKALLNAVTQLYLNEGYYTSRAVYPEQTITEGLLTIEIKEKPVNVRVEWQGKNRLRDRFIRNRLRATAPLNVPALEDELRVLRDDSRLATVEATLRRNDQAEADELVVQAAEARNFFGEFSTDNYSAPSLGGERLGVTFGLRNLSGMGDRIVADYKAATSGGYHSLDLNYEAPVNSSGGTLQFSSAFDFSKVTQGEFKDLNLRGERSRYELAYRQPLRKSSLEEFAVSAGLIYTTGTTFAFGIPTPFGFGAGADGTTRTTVLRFSQDYLRRDPWGAWVGSSNFNFGLGVFDATENDAPTPDGRFFSWLGQFQRVQRLNQRHVLLAQLDIQFSPNTLLPSQQFTIGGGQSIRGYRQNLLIADNGFRFSVEDRITLLRDASGLPSVQVAPFLDVGAAINTKNNPNSLSQNQNVLAGLGVGILWDPRPDFSLRLDYGYPLVDLDVGENIQDQALYFNGSFQF